MKKFNYILFIFLSMIVVPVLSAQNTDVFKIKGFYLDMSRIEVKEIYDNLKKNEVAQYISFEKENFRDLIKLDNEFSSMGNKIEIAYEEDEKLKELTFQYKTVNILFKAEKLSAAEFVQQFKDEFGIAEMEYKDMGFVKKWSYTDKKRNIKISIDDSKNLRLQKFKNK